MEIEYIIESNIQKPHYLKTKTFRANANEHPEENTLSSGANYRLKCDKLNNVRFMKKMLVSIV